MKEVVSLELWFHNESARHDAVGDSFDEAATKLTSRIFRASGRLPELFWTALAVLSCLKNDAFDSEPENHADTFTLTRRTYQR